MMLKRLCIFACLLCLTGCGSVSDRMQNSFNEGRYVESARDALSIIRNPEHKEKVTKFLETYGESLFEKAILQGDLLTKRDSSENPLYYWKSLIAVTDELVLADAPVANLKTYQKRIETAYNEAASAFRQRKIEEGKQLYQKQFYRDAVKQFRTAQQYGDADTETKALLRNAFQQARRQVVFFPLYKPVNGVDEIFKQAQQNEAFKTLTKSTGIRLIFEDLDVAAAFNRAFYSELSEKKSEFISLERAGNETTKDSPYYQIVGILDVTPEEAVMGTGLNLNKQSDTLEYSIVDGFGIKTTTAPFDFFLYTATYTLTFNLKLMVLKTDTQQKIAQVEMTKTFQDKITFRSDPISVPLGAFNIRYPQAYLQLPANGIIDKKAFLRKSIELSAQDFSKALLEKIDKETL